MSQQAETKQVQLSYPPAPVAVSIQWAKQGVQLKNSLAAMAREPKKMEADNV